MNSTPASFKPFQSVLTSSLVRATMYLAGSPLRPRTSLMRPQGERRGSPVAEHDEPRSLNRHPEAQHVTIERQQIAPASDGRMTQPPIVFRMLPTCSSM